MKIALFTPTIQESAIARMACLITRALVVQGHEVVIVRTENECLHSSTTHDFRAELIPWNDADKVSRLALDADTLVYQMGNNYDFHHGCLEWLPRFPGIVCLHDCFLGRLFFDWAKLHRPQADATLRTWYGAEVAQRFFGYDNDDAFKVARDAAPMTEWICSMADGVISHRHKGVERILNSCPGPVHIVPLACDAPRLMSNNKRSCSSDNDKFRILTIGHINLNQRVDSVIRAIGNSSLLRQRSIYRLVGCIQPETVHELSALARNCRVDLVISGAVDDVTLAHAIDEADVISCLCLPSLEVALAPAVEAMFYGKPTIVTDTGLYSELPDSCVKKIDPDNEINSLQSALELLYKNLELRCDFGILGQEWAESKFTPGNYAQKLIDIVILSNKAKPIVAAANYFTGVMDRWGATENLLNLDNIVAPLRVFSE